MFFDLWEYCGECCVYNVPGEACCIVRLGKTVKEITMADRANPYAQLVRMLELRLARQKQALQESELQLAGAKESWQRVEDQIDAEKQKSVKK